MWKTFVDCKGVREDGIVFDPENDRTKQSFLQEVDINRIIDKYDNTGIITHLNRAEARYEDVSDLTDFYDAMETVRRANVEFMKLPAHVRKIFDNDPAKFLDAAHDPEKRDKLAEAGLIDIKVTEAPTGASEIFSENGGSAEAAAPSEGP